MVSQQNHKDTEFFIAHMMIGELQQTNKWIPVPNQYVLVLELCT